MHWSQVPKIHSVWPARRTSAYSDPVWGLRLMLNGKLRNYMFVLLMDEIRWLMQVLAETKTAYLRFAHIFACVAFGGIYYFRTRIHSIPPYTEYSTDITDVTDCTLEWLQPSLFSLFKGRERNEKYCASGFRFFFRFLKFPWLSGLRGCVTCKHYVTPLCKIPNCFSPLYNRKKLTKYPSVFCYYLWKGCTIRRPIVCLFSLKLWEKYHFRPISCMFWHEKEAHY